VASLSLSLSLSQKTLLAVKNEGAVPT